MNNKVARSYTIDRKTYEEFRIYTIMNKEEYMRNDLIEMKKGEISMNKEKWLIIDNKGNIVSFDPNDKKFEYDSNYI